MQRCVVDQLTKKLFCTLLLHRRRVWTVSPTVAQDEGSPQAISRMPPGLNGLSGNSCRLVLQVTSMRNNPKAYTNQTAVLRLNEYQSRRLDLAILQKLSKALAGVSALTHAVILCGFRLKPYETQFGHAISLDCSDDMAGPGFKCSPRKQRVLRPNPASETTLIPAPTLNPVDSHPWLHRTFAPRNRKWPRG